MERELILNFFKRLSWPSMFITGGVALGLFFLSMLVLDLGGFFNTSDRVAWKFSRLAEAPYSKQLTGLWGGVNNPLPLKITELACFPQSFLGNRYVCRITYQDGQSYIVRQSLQSDNKAVLAKFGFVVDTKANIVQRDLPNEAKLNINDAFSQIKSSIVFVIGHEQQREKSLMTETSNIESWQSP